MRKVFNALIVSLVCFMFLVPKVSAAERIYPDTASKYNLKRLVEKTRLTLSFGSANKVKYMQKLLEERLLELEYISETKNIAFIEKASQRYETTAGQMTTLIIDKSLKSSVEVIKDLFEKHTEILKFMQRQFPFNTGEWRLIQNDINSLEIYSQQLSSF